MSRKSLAGGAVRSNRSFFYRLTLGLVLIFGVQGCMSLNNIFYWADTYLAWQIDDYFDLTNEQKAFVDKGLNRFFLSYKYQEIPKYIEFLQEVKSRSGRQINEPDLVWFWDSLRQFNENIANLLAEDVSLFLASLEQNQIPYFQSKLNESNENWLEEREERLERTAEERLERRYERIEDWVGSLSEAQKEQIAVLYPMDGKAGQFRYSRRLGSQQRFLNIIESNHETQSLKTQLLDWYLKPEQYYSKEYQSYVESRNQRSMKLILMLDKTATKKQRQFFHDKLDDYVEELQQIISGQ